MAQRCLLRGDVRLCILYTYNLGEMMELMQYVTVLPMAHEISITYRDSEKKSTGLVLYRVSNLRT